MTSARITLSLPSDEEIITAYEELRSCWKVGKLFGVSGQAIHARLQALGRSNPINVFTEDEKERLVHDYNAYVADGRLADLASEMGRTKQFLCRQAGKLGLTNKRRPTPQHEREANSQRAKRWHSENPHPRGALGLVHTQEARAKIGAKTKATWAALSEDEFAAKTLKVLKTKCAKNGGKLTVDRKRGSWAAGWREVGGRRVFFRSSWEANYGRYLQWLKERGEIREWEHEPETFWFDAVKRGVRTYLPDFRVWENNGESRLHEVKGWFDDRSKTKLKRMAKYHPGQTIVVIDAQQYRAIDRAVSSLIEGWEREGMRAEG